MPLSVGQVINNRFEIKRVLSQGDFEAVYQAYDRNLLKLVVLKENLQYTPALTQLFEREAQLLVSLSHPNLPKVSNYFTMASGQYLVMDYIEGQTLKKMLERHGNKPLDERQLLLWLDQVCDALSYLHEQNPHIIHRDVKPDNIIVTAGGKVFLVDFGIAKNYHTQHNPTTTTQAGTAYYAPPEQLGAGRTDDRSDVYAVGATMYHLLTGHYPPTSGNLIVPTEQLKPPRQYNSRLNRKTERAILKAMELTAPRRYQTIADFRRALPLPDRNGVAGSSWWAYVSRVAVLLTLGGLAILFFVANYGDNFAGDFWEVVWIGSTTGAETPPELVEGEMASTDSATRDIPPNMVLVPAGEFTMGSENGDDDEKPKHKVYVDEFFINLYKVTNEQYVYFLNAEGNQGGAMWLDLGDSDVLIEEQSGQYQPKEGYKNHPVVEVSWYGARAYCEWVGKRLPTEAEWEKAARGTDGRIYPWGNEEPSCERLQYGLCSGRTVSIGRYELGKSPYGAYDMAGNVWEWTLSEYKPYPYDKDDGRNDTDKNVLRVLRGGSWGYFTGDVRATNRNRNNPANSGGYIGFRCARSP